MHTDIYGKEHRYAPPVGWTQPAFESFSADEDWKRVIERGLQFEPYSGPSTSYGVRGECMEPLLIAGKHIVKVRPVASDEPLVDGLAYLILWNNVDEEVPYKTKMGIPVTERLWICKILRFIAGCWRCQCKDSIAELNGVVVGMVVAVSGCTPEPQAVHARQPICGGPFNAESVACAQLGINAATIVATASNAGPIVENNTSGSAIVTQPVSVSMGAPLDNGHTLIVTVTCEAASNELTNFGGSVNLQAFMKQGSTLTQGNFNYAANTRGPLTMQYAFAPTMAGGAILAGVNVITAGATQSTLWQVQVQAELVRR